MTTPTESDVKRAKEFIECLWCYDPTRYEEAEWHSDIHRLAQALSDTREEQIRLDAGIAKKHECYGLEISIAQAILEQSRDSKPQNNPTAKEVHLYDVYDALGIKWGDDPFSAINKLKDSEPKGVEREKLLEITEQVYRLGTIDGKNGAYLLHPSINATDAIMKLLEGR